MVLLDDVLLRNGGHRSGSLTACVSSSCTLDGQPPIARDDIAGIGIGAKAPSEAADDEDVILLARGARKVARVHRQPFDLLPLVETMQATTGGDNR